MKKIHLLIVGLISVLTSLASAQELDIKEMEPGFHKLEVTHPDGTLQRYISDIPEGYDGSKAVPMILGLHYGFGGMFSDDRPEPYWTEGFLIKYTSRPLNRLVLFFLLLTLLVEIGKAPKMKRFF